MNTLEIALLLCSVAGAAWSLRAWMRYRRKNILRERASRGQAGEARAHADLRRLFARVEAHPRRTQRLWIDGREQQYELTPDFLVGSKRRPILIEVKSGRDRSPDHPKTRRQLLEYALAFRARRIGLYDAHTAKLHWVRFECLDRHGARLGWTHGVCFGLGALVVWLWCR